MKEQLFKNALNLCGTFIIIQIGILKGAKMAKRGRPQVDKPKNVKVGFRVTEEERDRLFAYCEKMNLTQAQVLKEALELLYKTKP